MTAVDKSAASLGLGVFGTPKSRNLSKKLEYCFIGRFLKEKPNKILTIFLKISKCRYSLYLQGFRHFLFWENLTNVFNTFCVPTLKSSKESSKPSLSL